MSMRWTEAKGVLLGVFPGVRWKQYNSRRRSGGGVAEMGPFSIRWTGYQLGIRASQDFGHVDLYLSEVLSSVEELEKGAMEAREIVLGWCAGFEQACGTLDR